MTGTGPPSAAVAGTAPGGSRGSGGPPAALAAVQAAVRAPVTRRAGRELLFCLVAAPLGFAPILAPYCVFLVPLLLAWLAPGVASSWVALLGMTPALLLLPVLAPGAGRVLGAAHRRLMARLLGERVPPPPPFRPGRGVLGRVGASLRDGPGWRAVGFLLLTLPVAVLECYAVFVWVGGLVDLSYPFWWNLFRHHPPGVVLSPVPVNTPFPDVPFHVGTFAGTFLAAGTGAAMVLTGPWLTRAATSVHRRLAHRLLGPGRLAQRVRDLEQTRALAVDDSAALLRQVERDLHDGAQVRLAALAMYLGLAKEKLGAGGEPDLGQVRELVEAAHRGAKDALVELRDLAKGIHPPVLDSGLADALATLAAGSAIRTELVTDVPVRPTPAIETIAYFCAAELLANAVKHSAASRVEIRVTGRDGLLRLSVCDDGTGGADPARGSGLRGLAQRVSTVDGRLRLASPPGGPTRVTVELPLRA